MNTATNPRTHGSGSSSTSSGAGGTGTGDSGVGEGGVGEGGAGAPAGVRLERRTRARQLLDGLVTACKTALAAGTLPATGGHRPQVMVTINYRDLLTDLTTTGTLTPQAAAAGAAAGDPGSARGPDPGTQHSPGPGSGRTPARTPARTPGYGTGTFTYTGPVTPATVRRIACDADIIPLVLGTDGQILDIGRTSRIFPPHIRKAITARDQGCSFPACTIPATWCEVHHIDYWSRGGPTSTTNGTLECTYHHHLIHKEHWKIQVRNGIPWHIPPPHIDPTQTPQRNHYHHP